MGRLQSILPPSLFPGEMWRRSGKVTQISPINAGPPGFIIPGAPPEQKMLEGRKEGRSKQCSSQNRSHQSFHHSWNFTPFLPLHFPRHAFPYACSIPETQILFQAPLQSSRQPESSFSFSFSQISAPGGKPGVVPAPSQPPKLSLFFSRAVNPDTELFFFFFPLAFSHLAAIQVVFVFWLPAMQHLQTCPGFIQAAESGTELSDTKVWDGLENAISNSQDVLLGLSHPHPASPASAHSPEWIKHTFSFSCHPPR